MMQSEWSADHDFAVTLIPRDQCQGHGVNEQGSSRAGRGEYGSKERFISVSRQRFLSRNLYANF